jgi:hypothetical protein
MENSSTYASGALSALVMPWYSHGIESDSPIVLLAYRIAEEAHRKQVREKKVGNVPYITHPLMVCKLLKAMGRGDPLNLAIALLHDVLEDCEPYRSTPGQLKKDITEGLLAAGYDERGAINIASYINQHCEELCNDQIMEEGKRTFQVMHAHAMTDRSKVIKILDQTASVMDDIFLESKRPKDKIERFAMKALNVVKAASRGGTPEINAAADIFRECYKKLRTIHMQAVPHDADRLRNTFDAHKIMAHAVEIFLHKVPMQLEQVHWYGDKTSESSPIPQSGCVVVYFSRDAKGQVGVSGYDCLVDRVIDNFSIANRAAWYFLGELESFKNNTHVDTGQARVESKQLVRHYSISPPVSSAQFIAAARASERQVIAAAKENGVYDERTTPRMPTLGSRFTVVLQKMERDLSKSTFIS